MSRRMKQKASRSTARNKQEASRSTARNKLRDKVPPLPDTSQWKPRSKAIHQLSAGFERQCAASEELIRLRSAFERRFNVDNYDSGPGVEDVIREEFRRLIPSRYAIRPGVLIDRDGYTSGDFDLVLFSDSWFTAVKSGATRESRRYHLPVEGVYGVIEVKQTLGWASFDQAMGKLVSAHRLHRPHTGAHRLTENREGSGCDHGLTNPLFSAIVATNLDDGLAFNDVVGRFFDICKTLKRLEVVRALCVLGHGAVVWGAREVGGAVSPALFMNRDLCYPIVPVFVGANHGCPLYHLMSNLLLHLYHSILGPEDIAALYGDRGWRVQVPNSPEIEILPDPEWLAKYAHPCEH